ncbi:uncharacterized protein PRCAT00005157001 [Priceomyces carsonii]|uniref:uncharacterized protein n=1 Tax=Priceomyces carsonii TaxID=28549 RepID=UPI002ED77483|nr:unnamed protein product [Priceomyces carsonii]
MKAASIITIASMVCIAAAKAVGVNLVTESINFKDVDNKGLYSVYEGADLNFLFLGNSSVGQQLKFDANKTQLYDDSINYPKNFTVYDNVAALTVIQTNANFAVVGDYISINGSTTGFYACKNIRDPEQYSVRDYALTFFEDVDAPSGCKPVKVKVKQA